MNACDEVVDLAEKSGVSLAVKEGRLSITGERDAVGKVVELAKKVREALIFRLTAPSIQLTHRTIRDLTFNDPATGKPKIIPAGTLCRKFASQNAALLEGALTGFEGRWAAERNAKHGYAIVWLEGALRGVGESDISWRNDLGEKND